MNEQLKHTKSKETVIIDPSKTFKIPSKMQSELLISTLSDKPMGTSLSKTNRLNLFSPNMFSPTAGNHSTTLVTNRGEQLIQGGGISLAPPKR